MLYLFNPDTDLALAEFTPNYIAPAAIRKMQSDLAALPQWLCEAGDAILDLHTPSAQCHDQPVRPWGWNPTLVNRLSQRGGISNLPDRDTLLQIRRLSSRDMLPLLDNTLRHMAPPVIIGERMVARSRDELLRLSRHPSLNSNGFLMKELWSSSGRGLRWCRNGMTPEQENWALRCIRKQGGCMMEPIYSKVEDGAWEFESDGNGQIRFIGHSRFFTQSTGAYLGNYLATDNLLAAHFAHYLPEGCFVQVREAVRQALAIHYGSYCGPLGVDFMIVRQTPTSASPLPYAIHPSVEVNLRLNMGILARRFYDRWVVEGKEGKLLLEGSSSSAELWERHQRACDQHPCHYQDGRLMQGYLPLTQVTPDSRYRAYCLID